MFDMPPMGMPCRPGAAAGYGVTTTAKTRKPTPARARNVRPGEQVAFAVEDQADRRHRKKVYIPDRD